MDIDALSVVEKLDIPFLQSPWFYIAVLAVALIMKAAKDKDMKLHKRWYMPLAAALSLAASAGVILMVPEYTWGSIVIQTVCIYFGQHFFGDQIIKRFEKRFTAQIGER